MADNTELSPGSGGDTIRDVDKAGKKTQVVILDIGGSGAESLLTGTLPVSLASAPLPTGAATDTKQDTGNTSLASIDGKITAVNTGAVVVSSSALPSGAATALRQDTGNTSVASIDTKTPALGQALAAASVPIVLTAIQQAALTPPAAITGYALETGGNLATVKTNTDPLVAAGAGGYVRQDSTATIAKESGGNLATLVARTPALGAAATAASSPVTIASDQTVPVSNASLTTIAAAIKAEDSIAAEGDSGIQSLGVRQDIPATDTSLTGDYSPFKTDSKGRVWVASDVMDAIQREQNDVLYAILTEMRVMNHLLQTGLNVRDDLDGLRQDDYYNGSLQ